MLKGSYRSTQREGMKNHSHSHYTRLLKNHSNSISIMKMKSHSNDPSYFERRELMTIFTGEWIVNYCQAYVLKLLSSLISFKILIAISLGKVLISSINYSYNLRTISM